MNFDDFDFESIDAPSVDKADFGVDSKESMPSIVWHSSGEWQGHWVVNAEEVDMSMSIYNEDWSLQNVTFSSGSTEESWVSRRFRGIPMGERECSYVDYNGQIYMYKKFTAKAAMVNGGAGYQRKIQVPAYIPGVSQMNGDGLVMLSLARYTRAVAWDNVEKGPRRRDGFPTGARVQLALMSEKASSVKKMFIPWQCSWIIDLVEYRRPKLDGNGMPVMVNGKIVTEPAISRFGSGSKTSSALPYAIDLRVNRHDPSIGLDGRYVGKGMFNDLYQLRKDVIIPWEKEWDSFDNDASDAAPQARDDNFFDQIPTGMPEEPEFPPINF